MRFLVDANLSPDVARLLTAAGHDAVAVRDLGLRNAADDEILDRALIEDRVIVSHDTDFGTLLAVRRQTKPSFVLVRSADPFTAKQVAGLSLTTLMSWSPISPPAPLSPSLVDTCAHGGCRFDNQTPATEDADARPYSRRYQMPVRCVRVVTAGNVCR